MGQIALWAAIASFVAVAVLLLLAALGLLHARRVSAQSELFAGEPSARVDERATQLA